MINELQKFKILYGYPNYPAENTYGDAEKVELDYLRRLQQCGFDVQGFCLTVDPPAQCLTFRELDRQWKYGDKKLLKLYEYLQKAIEGKDILINAAGINLHPEFVEQLPVFTVFQCFDDPENSHNLSKPVAASYDLCLVGNIAELETYKSWGIQNVEWTTLSINSEMYDKNLSYEMILSGEREIDLFMMMDKLAPWRRERLQKLSRAFPDAHFYGNGWSKGFLAKKDEVSYLQRTKIGPNIHNSTGPINLRTFYLPANGVLQICDNKQHLAKLFTLNEEVVGFDTIEECIDLCNYYLTHEEERRKIAANGWERAIRDYNEEAVFKRKLEIIDRYYSPKETRNNKIILNTYRDVSKPEKIFYYGIMNPWWRSIILGRQFLRRIKKSANRMSKNVISFFE
ncbi:MAG: glycosyltransferase [Bacteroidota bacterium]|nr:glycosyltransferase [Bacteroidota bacterium]